MESIPRPKKPGAARVGALAGGLLLVLLLALPCAWYARYHDQLATPTVKSVRFGVAPPSRPSGAISLAPPIPGQTRTVRIQHTGGQVVTTVNDGNMQMTVRALDPRPPSNPLDALGQSLCDRYNAWETERGDPRQRANVIGPFMGRVSVTYQIMPNPGAPTGMTFTMSTPPAHAPGTRAPGSFLHRAAHMPARP